MCNPFLIRVVINGISLLNLRYLRPQNYWKMMFRGLLAERSAYRQLLVLVGFALFFVMIFSMLGGLFSTMLFGVNPLSNPSIMNDTGNPQVVNALKLMQAFSAFGLFVFPVVIAAFLFDSQPVKWLKLDKQFTIFTLLLVIVTIIVGGPLINWMNELNKHLSLPGALKGIEEWMRNAEDRAAEITRLFLETRTYSGLAVNLLVIALIPAIGEELLFRGAAQKLLTKLTNKHAGIILSAIVFSAMHLQFYGFLPRMMLGIYFGYIVLWMGSLWPAIIGHFINNAAAVILTFLQNQGKLSFNADTVGTNPGDELVLLFSTIIVAVCTFYIYRSERKMNPWPADL